MQEPDTIVSSEHAGVNQSVRRKDVDFHAPQGSHARNAAESRTPKFRKISRVAVDLLSV